MCYPFLYNNGRAHSPICRPCIQRSCRNRKRNIFIIFFSKQTNDGLINIICSSFFFVWFFELWASSNYLNSTVSIVNEKINGIKIAPTTTVLLSV